MILLLILVDRLRLSPQCLLEVLSRCQHARESSVGASVLLDTVGSKLILVAFLELLHEVASIQNQLVHLFFLVGGDGLLIALVVLRLWLLLELRELIQLLLNNHLYDQTADEPVLLQPLLELSA
mgnify:CR=1 FL=1